MPNDEALPKRARRQPLSKDAILLAALTLVESEGLAALSMRKLGKSLGVEAMALYRYVPNREALLNAMVDHVIDQMSADPERELEHCEDWRSYLLCVGSGIHRVALTHPKLFPLIASQPPEAPWIRPPIRSLDWVNGFLEGLLRHGMSSEQSVDVYRSFTSFLLGQILLEVSWTSEDLIPTDDSQASPKPELDLSNHPVLGQLMTLLAQPTSQREFRVALEQHIDCMERSLSIA